MNRGLPLTQIVEPDRRSLLPPVSQRTGTGGVGRHYCDYNEWLDSDRHTRPNLVLASPDFATVVWCCDCRWLTAGSVLGI
jgi:hypothetical protein